MRVPPPGGLTNSIVPPLASARSRKPSRPEPERSTAPPTPSSAISSLSIPRAAAARTSISEAPEYFCALAIASATT